jgi:hypothetical protein
MTTNTENTTPDSARMLHLQSREGMTMTTITDQLAEALRNLSSGQGDTKSHVMRAWEALAAYDATHPASAHTPTLWRLEAIELHEGGTGIAIVAPDGTHIASNQSYYPAAVTPENARRIVACVNACADIPTEALEGASLVKLDGDPLYELVREG